ncbi:hypothetical protein Sme01_04020 [Sphaerisporangium melleum]|uniref:DUF7736 domain-containing protein n=1 Tax=Sphaerisporangium melleum TaxID=321316 RepID=A0A917QPL6_9ACTN|nr:hypothetical protein [Sphaerisporangium melleum]GGK62099.1 hypothetical protein GCM10007964_01570 [Sphaerisporangium melleum]GII67926.1 hypothetical protein Sme01_04020 [Sphaerisporangium melleum]
MSEREPKVFHLGDILTVTTDRLVSPDGMDGVYQILNWMTGESLFTHQLIRAAKECAESLREQHPALADIDVPDWVNDEATVKRWLDSQVSVFGEWWPVEPLAPGQRQYIDPVTELRQMTSGRPVHVVEVDGHDPS